MLYVQFIGLVKLKLLYVARYTPDASMFIYLTKENFRLIHKF